MKILGGEQGLGYPKCFFDALSQCDGRGYFSFCDQDDVWEPYKISRAAAALDDARSDQMLMYYCSYDYYNADMHFIRHAYFQKSGPPHPGLAQLSFGGEVRGFAMVINEAGKDYLCKFYKDKIGDALGWWSKDVFCDLTTAALGTVIYDNKACARYRRQPSATTYTGESSLRDLISKARNLWKKHDLVINTLVLKYLKDEHTNAMSKEDLDFCLRFSADARSFSSRMRKVFWPHRLRAKLMDEAALRLLFAFGKDLPSKRPASS